MDGRIDSIDTFVLIQNFNLHHFFPHLDSVSSLCFCHWIFEGKKSYIEIKATKLWVSTVAVRRENSP